MNKDDQSSYIAKASQKCSIELFTLPASDGTPSISLDYPQVDGSKRGLIDNSFVFVANQVSLDESLEMPLALIHVDRDKHWKKL